jgi:hypothetical protein
MYLIHNIPCFVRRPYNPGFHLAIIFSARRRTMTERYFAPEVPLQQMRLSFFRCGDAEPGQKPGLPHGEGRLLATSTWTGILYSVTSTG